MVRVVLRIFILRMACNAVAVSAERKNFLFTEFEPIISRNSYASGILSSVVVLFVSFNTVFFDICSYIYLSLKLPAYPSDAYIIQLFFYILIVNHN